MQTRYVNAFLKDVFNCITEDIATGSGLLSCQITKHGMLHLLLRKHGIAPADMIEPQSLSMVMRRLRAAAQELENNDIGQTKNSCIKEKSARRAKRGEPCDYCWHDFTMEFTAIIGKHNFALPGFCLLCFRAGKPHFLVEPGDRHECNNANAWNDSTGA
ncbi:hypothetical protein A1O7_07632 [Cladophialophora yegresii CBS 114405]|uniref:Uncharacterized protein n=1 Tax=Cladophialophora yegresii CBS 114405 TaxID=1182544 RepID=W9VX50_9EURO|nr:uncharacterized protein A1O7_07632 [Cladophialophora yegresii CBS 114405]EXJ57285.1 hypothetical protein A1O7_07632 [Cladophialophora yegresii CBS 114405]